jgi:acylphosphatase
MDANKIELHLIAQGRVQGVGYRYTVANIARSLNLTGTVCNLGDGSVEIFVQGEKSALAAFQTLIVEQVSPALVSHISAQEISPCNTYQGFKIVY